MDIISRETRTTWKNRLTKKSRRKYLQSHEKPTIVIMPLHIELLENNDSWIQSEPIKILTIQLEMTCRACYFYIIQSTTTRRTYVGATYDLGHRLRQHNGQIKGGAKATRCGRPWKLVLAVTGFISWTELIKFEWRMHHPGRQLRGYGLEWRLRCLSQTINQMKWLEVPTSLTSHYTFKQNDVIIVGPRYLTVYWFTVKRTLKILPQYQSYCAEILFYDYQNTSTR